ncbi:uncharacterized protein LOC143846767 [Tasmannia lanceolata]|uniref:uncharacterized protein LOC143846767 n=1 Tax=Tasmannia lanceolata TaxID=3420 RepID=UPI004064BCED
MGLKSVSSLVSWKLSLSKPTILYDKIRCPSNPNSPHFIFSPFQYVSNSSPKSPITTIINPIPFITTVRNPNPNPLVEHGKPNRNPNFLNSFLLRSSSIAYYPSSWSLKALISYKTPVVLFPSINLNYNYLAYYGYSNPNFSSWHSLQLLFRSFSNHSDIISKKKPGMLNSNGNHNPNSRISRRNTKHMLASHIHNVNPDEFMDIVELIKRGENDMELKLNEMNLNLSPALVSELLNCLSDCGTSAWRFYDWVTKTRPNFDLNSQIYNQMVNNLGRLEDYELMLLLLRELSRQRHCLTEKAFAFFSVCSSDRVRMRDSVVRVVETLNGAGGSCRSSGIHTLIKMLCAMNFFDLAIFVMVETSRKTSYYNILIAAKCRNSKFQEAQHLFEEMKRFGCDPNVNSYNYLLGSLCKKERIAEACELLEVMEKLGYIPDAITFEIVTYHACRLGRIDFAMEFLYQMMSEGLEPRITTHAAFIKGYFWSGRPQDAHKYVVEMSAKDKCSGIMNYSLLASLYRKSGKVVEAREVLVEMIENGLKPNFPVYMRVMKDLYKLGMRDLVADLKCRFSKFHSSENDG